MTERFDGQKTRQPLGLSSSTPTQQPIATRPPSLSPPSVRTQTFDPQGRSRLKSGSFPVATSRGVAPCKALVGVLFFNHTAWRTASPQRKRASQQRRYAGVYRARYSPPRSEWSVFTRAPCCVWLQASKSLYAENALLFWRRKWI